MTVIADDLIVQGKACIGVPWINGETFGTGTLRLKDRTRIDFINTLPFAPRGWRIEASSTVSGERSISPSRTWATTRPVPRVARRCSRQRPGPTTNSAG